MRYNVSDAVKSTVNGVFIDIHVISRSKGNELGFNAWEPRLRVKVKSPPQKGKANDEVIGLFKRMLGSCEITSGCLSPKKTVFIRNCTRLEVVEKIESNIEAKEK